VWWPREPQGVFQARSVVDAATQTFILHYPGNGCASLKRYGYGTKNFYDLLFEKALEIVGGAG
jgi:hypothetical protein